MNEIKASDLARLMDVVEAAAGLYNELEKKYTTEWVPVGEIGKAWHEVGQALRELGLHEVTVGP